MKAVIKEAGIDGAGTPGVEELALINQFAKRELKAEEVYAFSVKLCDNEVDRDFERFPAATLEQLAPLFVGKSGVFDHQWSAKEQTARIYRTEVVREEGVTLAGEGYCYLKGYAYLLRNERNLPLIQELDGGIKKEVSVGCAVARTVCSICGEEPRSGRCQHVPGKKYGGKLCWTELLQATDAYEFSFVAVPAQPKAGVMKMSVKGGVDLDRLEREAQLGRRYLARLRGEVIRLGGLAEPELRMDVLKGIAGKLDEEELLALRGLYAKRVEKKLPVTVQLKSAGEDHRGESRDSAFLI